MRAARLSIFETANMLLNSIMEFLFNIFVYISKPIAQSIYKKYRTFKKYSIRKQKRMKRDFMRKSAIVGFACALGILFAFSMNIFSSNVKAEDDGRLHKYYTFYTVEPGDSLWEVADEFYELGYDNHEDYIDEIMFINHIKDANDITSGDTLVIPYYSYEIK
ncbi:MAG: LysM peptidoglycan-binding domain-containing protein [Lachnospiraceae bacterium]|nr:LysM peptidoglycan-binding domain-containing protein [Lachnospiraceae bacterium]